jgi:hypothetical protein
MSMVLLSTEVTCSIENELEAIDETALCEFAALPCCADADPATTTSAATITANSMGARVRNRIPFRMMTFLSSESGTTGTGTLL